MAREWFLNWGGTKSSKKKGSSSGGSGKVKKPVMPQASVANVAAAAASAGGCMNAVLHMFDIHHLQCLHPNDNPATMPVQPTTTTTFSLGNVPTIQKGVEAPRNSLESEEMVTGPPSLASITEDEKDDASHIPMGIHINTRRDAKLKLVQAPRGRMEDFSSESSCSPAGSRTPNLVARLMGLDILPESTNTTPRSSHSQAPPTPHTAPIRTKNKIITRTKGYYCDNDVPGPRSLPETPKVSSSRRRSTDTVDHHRLSLQINKENFSIVKELESSRPSCSAISTKRSKDSRSNNYEEETKSPGYYARQIMKQVRETVSRRVGLDITNTIGQREHRRDEHLLSTMTTKSKKSSSKKESPISPCKSLPHSPLSRLKNSNSEPESRLKDLISEAQAASECAKPQPVDVAAVALVRKQMEEKENVEHQVLQNFASQEKNAKKMVEKSCSKKPPPKAFDSVRNKKEDQFVRPQARVNGSSEKKSKKTPLSSDLLHPSLVPLKKDPSSPQPPRLLDKQGASSKAQPSKLITSSTTTNTDTDTDTNTSNVLQLSRTSSQQTYERVKEEVKHTLTAVQVRERSRSDTSSISEFQYISRILKCTGIDRDTPVSFARWFSASHPLDPSIYHTLEASSDHLSLAINRRLIFHLVDEMLADILKPYINNKPWMIQNSSRQDYRHHHQHQQQMNGFQLVKILCTRIRSLPSADCQTLQDIDSLVEKDLPRHGVQSSFTTFEEEGETIVQEIERDIVDTLVQEITLFSLGNHRSSLQRYVTSIRV